MAVIYRKEGEKAVSLPSFSVAGAFTGTLYMLFHGYFKWAVVEVMADFALVIFAVILGTVMGHSWADIQFGFMLVLGTILSVMSSTVLRKEGVTMTFDSMPQQDANLMEKALQVMLLKEDPSTLMNWLNEPNVDVRVIAIIKYILSTGEGL